MGAPAYFDEGRQYNLNPLTEAFLTGIANAESGGEADPYNATSPDGGARGKYMFTPDTYADVARQFGGDGEDWSPENQEYLGRQYASYLLDKYGPRGASQAWLGGEGSVGNDDVSDGYITTGEYANNVLDSMNNYINGGKTNINSQGGPYQANLIEAYRKAGVKFDDTDEPFPSDFVRRMVSQPTVNASQRVKNDFLQGQSPEITARAMGAYRRNKDFFDTVNKMSADAAREGAGIENKNMQKTMAAQFADQIAQSNSSANIALLAKIGAALTGVQFDPNSKHLADMGQLALKQMEINNQIIKANQAQANADRSYALMRDRLSYSRGGAGGGAGSGGNGEGSPIGYVLEDDDSIKNNVDRLVNSPEFKQYQNIIWNPSSSSEVRDLATKGALKMIADYGMSMAQAGKRGTMNELVNNIAASVISQAQDMSHPAGTNPADQDAQNETNQGLLNNFMNTVIGSSTGGQPLTLADVQNSLNTTENMVSQGQLVNRW